MKGAKPAIPRDWIIAVTAFAPSLRAEGGAIQDTAIGLDGFVASLSVMTGSQAPSFQSFAGTVRT
jgi:hypothetical protein